MDLELYFDKIEQYAEGLLPEAERAAFEAELAENADLREALHLYRIGNEAIEQGIENNLRQQLQSWGASDSAPPVEVKPRARIVSMQSNWIRLAAAACFVLLAGWFLLQWAGGAYTDEALFSSNYELPEAGTFRSGGTVENPLEPGFKALENKDFQAAANFFASIPADHDRYAEAQYYLGHANLNLGQFDDALAAFETVVDSRDRQFRQKAEWNMILTYLAAHTNESVYRDLLHRIASDPAHDYQKPALELEGKLESFLRR